uniref:TSA: Wollemia nobilis Ref_Wollemi_Transcript_4614_1911 transcribed RNA sequence n=1 Tax=Wollemia nobilis TaxID=56998 RepID=A0A0C9S8F8_9CONI
MGKNKKKREWRKKMEEKGNVPKTNQSGNDEEESKGKDPSPPEAGVSSGPSVSGSLPSSSSGQNQQRRRPNALPSDINALSFDDKVEKLSQLLCDPSQLEGLELMFTRSGLRVSTELVEEVLKKSYKAGAAVQKFFQWAAPQLGNKHSPYAWNLLVDILGNNRMFDAMWEAVKSMKGEGILSRHTFASVFTCYAMAEKANEAIMTFEVMEHYGAPQDVAAFNCLLCALCRYRLTSRAQDFARKMIDKFPPDADTYAILLEGWEKEGDVAKAKKTFGEMVVRIGWDPRNTAAYNAFLGTLCKGGQVDEGLKFLHVMRSRNCHPDKSFYSTAIHALSLQNKAEEAAMVFDTMLRCGYLPSTTTYNSMISAYCYAGKMEDSYRLLDGMVWNGAFPDSVTYNTIFHALLKAHKAEEAASIFREMMRNEFDPDSDNLSMALMQKDLELATMVGRHLSRKGVFPDILCITVFVNNLCENNKRGDAKKYVEDMLAKDHKVSDEMLKKVKISSQSEKKDTDERSSKKRKDHH